MNKDLKSIQESGFKVPKNYLENFEASILSQAKLKEKVTKSGFTIPKGYLKNVEDTILTKVHKEESVKVIPLFSKRNIIYISSIAAVIALLFNLSNINTKATYDSLSLETVENYILNEDYSTDDLASLFTNVDLLEEDFNTISFSDEAMQEYLNNNLEINDLYTE
ncbi:hypothetical protein Q4512_08975 [Oceanihabitans sp. 2_MG-2023]|uniref:hypothetical protein n=1 Tax=Oceanihabitans sp. 2_MG-2023 TaxID=3062661 RepID=UPI0026E43277|nr:hypothetical protein [Oceanihabitans sp. 2_MG-2023]MDO6597047.1 hypothetical protein [Oceanihabitans sp. 2_MG-2023]